MFLRRLLKIVSKVGRPVLRILGVKRGTVADKAAEIVEIIEPTVSESEKPAAPRT